LIKSETSNSRKVISECRRIARGIRLRALRLTLDRVEGCYLSQALSSAEILAVLYGNILRISSSTAPKIPLPFQGVPRAGHHPLGAEYNGKKGPMLDRILLSAAHYAVAIYAVLVETGRLAEEGFKMFNTDGSSVEMIGGEHSPGMEITSGSFGQALSQAAGIAFARRLKKETGRVWVFMSDGEFEEGQTYEAVQTMAHYSLDNVGIFVDVNGQQVDGLIKDVMNIEPIRERLQSFGAKVVEVNGPDIGALINAAETAHPGQPLFILARTNPSEGVPLLDERKPHLHFVRFKNQEEKERYESFYRTMKESM
jgi:transketolase